MTENEFDFFWNNGIKIAAQSVHSSLLAEFKDDLTKKYNFNMDLSEDNETKVKNSYEVIRQRIRADFFNVGDDEGNRMDGHKICAAITGALLEARLFTFDKVDNIPEKIIYSNYIVAFYSSLCCLYLFVLSDYMKNDEIDKYDYLYNQKSFRFPQTNPGHDPYVVGRIKTIAVNDICGVDFDVLSYADMLFWIDKYNRYLVDISLSAQ